jgi:hypothetical protein
MPRRPPPGAPWLPPKWEVPDAGAMQALARGDASPAQQQRALDWIVTAACGTYELSFNPDSDRATAFAEGRRMVGLQIVKLIKVNLARLRQANGGSPDEQP